jgi:hypothetical protein
MAQLESTTDTATPDPRHVIVVAVRHDRSAINRAARSRLCGLSLPLFEWAERRVIAASHGEAWLRRNNPGMPPATARTVAFLAGFQVENRVSIVEANWRGQSSTIHSDTSFFLVEAIEDRITSSHARDLRLCGSAALHRGAAVLLPRSMRDTESSSQ